MGGQGYPNMTVAVVGSIEASAVFMDSEIREVFAISISTRRIQCSGVWRGGSRVQVGRRHAVGDAKMAGETQRDP